MLQLLEDDLELAYPVPFMVDRSRMPDFDLVNLGREPIHGIRLTLLGPGIMLPFAPRTLQPGDRATFTLLGEDLARSTVVIVRWFRPNEEQYLWHVSF